MFSVNGSIKCRLNIQIRSQKRKSTTNTSCPQTVEKVR